MSEQIKGPSPGGRRSQQGFGQGWASVCTQTAALPGGPKANCEVEGFRSKTLTFFPCMTRGLGPPQTFFPPRPVLWTFTQVLVSKNALLNYLTLLFRYFSFSDLPFFFSSLFPGLIVRVLSPLASVYTTAPSLIQFASHLIKIQIYKTKKI